MEESFVAAIEKAVEQLVYVFQDNPKRGWNERDLHWLLFHYLRKQEFLAEKDAINLIRAEFPTRKVYTGKTPARGHYDLVILKKESIEVPAIANMEPWDPWDKFLDHVVVSIAIEVKLWSDRQKKQLDELIRWDMDKLSAPENRIEQEYFLNFAQLDFDNPLMLEFYHDLKHSLAARQQPNVRILCVPHDKQIQSDNLNWLG